jgi:large subunit ribosomal protein L15
VNLEDLNRSVKAHTKRKRRGRGRSSGIGKTGGRGGKGQSARSGWDRQVGFEGGQMPIYRRLPRRGFSNARFRDADVSSINVDRLSKFTAGSVVNQVSLVEKGVINRFKGTLKSLGGGELKVALTVEAHAFSATAKEKIEKAGGKAVVIAASKAEAKDDASK